MNNQTHYFSYMLHLRTLEQKAFRELNLARALDEDTRVFFFYTGCYTAFKGMKNLIYHFPTCYAYSVKKPIGELNPKRALDEDTGVFSFFFSFLSSSSPLGQTAVTGNSTLHQCSWESLSFSLS